jgi:hypothetical protein
MWRIPASNSMIELTSTEYPSNLDYNKLTSMPEFKDMETIAWKY